MLRDLAIESIVRRADARALDETNISGLVDSISAVGLINPIRVRANGDGFEVVAGSHRFEAAKRLGLVEITCLVVDDDDLHAELAMIDENLCRAELSPSDRARQTARRKAIYEALHPETRNGVIGATARHAPANLADASFTADTAASTGKSERAIQRDAERGEKVIDEVLTLIRGTKLDTGTYLDKLKKLDPNDQVSAAKRDLALLRKAQRNENVVTQRSKVDADVKSRAAHEVAEIIAEYVPGEWWDAVKANLYAAGASNIAHELTNLIGQSVMDKGRVA